MHYPCPNCGVAGNNFTCTNHIINMGPRVPIQTPVSTPPGTDTLLAEIARLNVENYRLREENRSLKEMLSKLQAGNPTRAIKTPEGNPLIPAAEFSRMRIEDNKERGLSDCNWQRQTGRTTAMVIEALEFVKANRTGGVVIEASDNQMKKVIRDLLKHYADELSIGHRDLARIFVKVPKEHVRGVDIALRLRD